MVFKILFTIMNVTFLALIILSVHKIFKPNEAIKVTYMSQTFKLYTIQSYSGIMVIVGIVLLIRTATQSSDVESSLAQFYDAGILTYILLYLSMWLMSPKNFVVAKEGLYYRYRFGPFKKICESGALKTYIFDDKNHLRIKYVYRNQQVVDIRVSGQYTKTEITVISKDLKKMMHNKSKKRNA